MEYFITGIDTDIGKTFVTKHLAYAFQRQGLKAGVYKPLQSGAQKTPAGLSAPDIEAVKALSKDINTKCSYIFEGEVSPALAARLAGIKPDINKIKSDFNEFKKLNDITLIEGAGGLLAPALDNMLCLDLIKELDIPIIIVTAPFLGRLNHTLLTVRCALAENVKIKGIIVNKAPVKTDDEASKNFISELRMYTDVPILGVIKDSGADKEAAEAEFSQIIKPHGFAQNI